MRAWSGGPLPDPAGRAFLSQPRRLRMQLGRQDGVRANRGQLLHSYLPSTTTSAVMDMARPLSRHSGPLSSPATDATTITAITTTATMATIVGGMLEGVQK